MKRLFFMLIVLFAATILHAEEATVDSGGHFVERIVFVIDGNTSETALRRYVDLKEGDFFEQEEEFLRIAEREKQDLINYRVFKYVTMDLDKIGYEDGVTSWMVTYGVQDSWTLLPIPYPKYDSNTGFRLGLKTFYNNAFGTMTDAYLGLSMDLRTNKQTGKVEVGQWVINPAWSRIKIGTMYWRVDFLQAYIEEAFDSGIPATEYDFSYLTSNVSFGSYIDFPYSDWGYNFNFGFFMKYGYVDRSGAGNYREEPFNFAFNQSVKYGRVDWIENFRTGQNLNLGHILKYILNPEIGDNIIVNDLSLTGTLYRAFGGIFNYYGRATAFVTFNDRRTNVGSKLRGVTDNTMSGNYGFVLNNTLGIQFWRLEGVWDAQVHPFFDIGVAAPAGDLNWNRDLRYSTGADFVLYLDAVPNLVARATIGVDLGRYDWNDLQKYELIITSSLFY